MAYLVLLFSLVGLHFCVKKILSIISEIKRDVTKSLSKKRNNAFVLSDYVGAKERIT